MKVAEMKTPNYQSSSGKLLERWMKGLEPELSLTTVERLFAKNRDAVANQIRKMKEVNSHDFLIVDRLMLDAEVYAGLRSVERFGHDNRDIVDV